MIKLRQYPHHCCRFWSQKQGEFLMNGGSGSKSAKLEGLVSATLRHALMSMLVTSLTTTAAFLASLVSNITAIKCFRWGLQLNYPEGFMYFREIHKYPWWYPYQIWFLRINATHRHFQSFFTVNSVNINNYFYFVCLASDKNNHSCQNKTRPDVSNQGAGKENTFIPQSSCPEVIFTFCAQIHDVRKVNHVNHLQSGAWGILKRTEAMGDGCHVRGRGVYCYLYSPNEILFFSYLGDWGWDYDYF